jgi:HD-GYP domain-containing protein (c-di-GMP phosphodiesterase class II)
MTCDRPYRSAMAPGEALDEIKSGAGAQFDPAVVAALIDALAR